MAKKPNQLPNPEQSITLLKIAEAMDKNMSAFEADQNSIFSNLDEVSKLIHAVKKRAEKAQSPSSCFYPGCYNMTIANSHTIQQSASLKHTADAGHLLTPSSRKGQNTWLGDVGYRKASVFPGFCQQHENFFQRFEKHKDFEGEYELRMQLFRTICREIAVNRRVLGSLTQWVQDYITFRNEKLNENFYHYLKLLGLTRETAGITQNNYRFDNSTVVFLKNRIHIVGEYLRTLGRLHSAAFKDLQFNTEKHFYMQSIEIDIEIPVCLAGRGGLHLKKKSTQHEIDVIINVLPMPGKTYLIAGCFNRHKKYLQQYFSQYGENPSNLLTMVESWMLYGSDHWFLKPSVWNALNHDAQQQIYDEIYNSHKNICAIPPLIIFEKTRRDIIENYKSHGPEYAEIAAYLEKEMIEKHN